MSGTVALAAYAWPASRLGEAIEVLAERSGLTTRRASRRRPPPRATPAELYEWVVSTCEWLGIEALPAYVSLSELDAFVRASAPSVLRVSPPPQTDGDAEEEPRYVVLLRCRRGRVVLLAPDLSEARIAREHLADAISERLGADGTGIEQLLKRAALSGARLANVRKRITASLPREAPLSDGFFLRAAPEAPTSECVREAGLVRWLLGYATAHTADYLLFILSWWILGRAALGGYLDWGWLAAWGLVLFTMLPFRLGAIWFYGRFAVAAGGLLKRFLLLGALKLKPDEVRHLGSGHHLSRVIESEAVESMALGAGFLSLSGTIEIVLALGVLALGAGGWLHVLSLVAFCALTAAAIFRYLRRRERWTKERLDVSRTLVEKMVGHRTRLAQQDPSEWYEDEDAQLARYLADSRSMDDLRAWITVLPRVWLVIGILGLAPAFVTGSVSGSGVGALAVGLGGLLLAYRALAKLVTGLTYLASATISLEEVRDLLHASRRVEPSGDPSLALVSANEGGRDALVDVSDVSFRYEGRSTPTLKGIDLSIRPGEALLLLGPSGGGKSTLVSMLTGLRRPDGGLVLLHGLDRASLGSFGWSRRVASAPQFHENWILTETFAFNLLMGRRWPPTAEDLKEAEAVCRELGLGPLLERMPAGMMQMVGDTGWRLSHGEKSRLYAARALLQDAELTILDESFGALDPENLTLAVECARRRARTLLLVAHP